MNSKLINLTIVVLFVVYSCVPEVNAIRCYSCDSRTDKKCLTGGGTEEPCAAFVTSCVKIHGSVNDEEYVARGCNLVNTCAVSGFSSVIGNFKQQVNCENCNTDLCNGADSMIKSKQTGFFGVIVALMITKLLF